MSQLVWDKIGERNYETGVDHGVIYPQSDGAYKNGEAWNGLSSVNENPSGAEDNSVYADNMKYLNIKSAEEYGITIGCYTYPDAFAKCNGEVEFAEGVTIGQQSKNTFGFSYRTKIGNDTEGEDHGYKIHLVYGCSSSPSEKTHETINDSPSADEFSFEVSTTPVPVSGTNPVTGKPFKPTSILEFDSTKMSPEQIKKVEDVLYGTEDAEPRLPLPDEFKEILAAG